MKIPTISGIFGKVFSIGLFLLVTGITLFIAYGYQFDIDLQSVQKTSIIDIVKPDTKAQVHLDSELVEDSLPVQLTSILPGIHELSINKDGFSPWKRTVKVQEDIVSIVKDVLLVPALIDDYKKELLTFSDDEIVLNGFDYLLVYTPESSIIRMIFFGENGAIRDENINFFHSDFEVIENYLYGGLLLRLNDITAVNDLYAYVNFSKNQFSVFSLPGNVRKIRIDVDKELVFYLRESTLFYISFDDLDQDKRQEIEQSVLHEQVKDYDIDDVGNVYFISDGMLYLMNSYGGDVSRLDKPLSALAHVSFYEGNGYGMIVDMDEEKNRTLFVLDNEPVLTSVVSGLYGKPYMNSIQQILYANSQGDVYLYDVLEQEELLITPHIDGDFNLHGWFDDDHYLLEREGKLFIADLYNANEIELFDEFNASSLHVRDSALFYLENSRLMRIYWDIEEV